VITGIDRARVVVLTMNAAGLPEIAAWVASFGGAAVPLAPPELAEAVRERHAAGLEALAAVHGAPWAAAILNASSPTA
jgi:hypothetical protein